MIECYNKIVGALRDYNEDEYRTADIDVRDGTVNKAKRIAKQMEHIEKVTKIMQTRGYRLCECCAALDCLIEDVATFKTVCNHDLYQCRLGTDWIKPGAEWIVPNPQFESAVVKIQKGDFVNLSDAEKVAAASLRNPHAQPAPQAHQAGETLEDRINKN